MFRGRQGAEAPRRFGEIALEKGWLNERQLGQALALQQRERTPIGRICAGLGFLRHLHIRDILAEQHRLSTVDLLKTPPSPGMIRTEHRRDYHKLEFLPWREEDGVVTFAAVQPGDSLKRWIRKHYGENFRLLVTSPLDLQRTLAKEFAEEDSSDACFRLYREAPEQSARLTISFEQRLTLLMALLGVLVCFAVAPQETTMTVLLVLNLFFAATMLFKGILFYLGWAQTSYRTETHPPLADDLLPVYTVLVPLYKEKDALPHLLAALRGLDYPKSKLDVKLIVESDDAATLAALKALHPESYFEIIRVPVSYPRTKPKACNYALRFARGELVTVYDAEDQPEPDQLRKAAGFFVRHDGRVVCLQSRLNYYNRNQNLLTRLFAIEYGAWFDFMLRGLERLEIPIPLGGTSNHLPLYVLERLHAWDAHNVTEDADLGYRIAVAGGRSALLHSVTWEESPARLGDWVKQRSRWIKGYMQTYLVHMRRPATLLQRLGLRGFMGFQLFIGGPVLVYLSAPFLWGVWLLWMGGAVSFEQSAVWPLLMWLTVLNLWGGLLLHLAQAYAVIKRSGWADMSPAMLAFPFYWVLHSLAGFRALWQLVTRPHYWDKTPHRQWRRGAQAVVARAA